MKSNQKPPTVGDDRRSKIIYRQAAGVHHWFFGHGRAGIDMLSDPMADTFTVTRSIEIAAPADQIYPHLADFKRWTSWSPWEALDPNMERGYSGAEEGVGAVYTWSGNRKAGSGRMEIAEAHEPSEIRVALDFIKPFKSSNTTSFTLDPRGGTTHVVWTMVGPSTMFTKIMGIFKSMDSMIGPDFENGLNRLKAVVEGGA